MILTVTPNPALDVTYEVDALRPGAEHRVQVVRTRPGGKGVNVARVLTQLGLACTASGLAGGSSGAVLRAELHRTAVAEAFLETGVETRRTVVVTGAGTSTSFWEPGEPLPVTEADRLVAAVAATRGACGAVVVSGSLPPGLPVDVHARVAAGARAAGVPALVDADGAVLAAAAQLAGIVLKPNAAELSRLVGAPISDSRTALQALAVLRRRTTADWVVTLGAQGLVACTSAGSWVAAPPEDVRGSPTGAGDAVAAALAQALAAGPVSWPVALADAVALGAAAVLRPVAGEVDVGAYERWRRRVHVHAVPEGL